MVYFFAVRDHKLYQELYGALNLFIRLTDNSE